MTKRTIYPPHWLLLLLGVEFALWHWLPVARVVPSPHNWAGVVFIVAGLLLGLAAARRFARQKTGIVPFSESTAFVVDGPYRYTRNPMYLGMSGILLGAALLFGALTPFVAPVLFVAIITARFIVPEEAHMERAFGGAYLEFKRRTRRWI